MLKVMDDHAQKKPALAARNVLLGSHDFICSQQGLSSSVIVFFLGGGTWLTVSLLSCLEVAVCRVKSLRTH